MPRSQYIAYAAPSIIMAFLFSPMGILQGIYAKYFGISLTTIALVLFVSRIFDAVTDPLIGYWSDRYYVKFGSRKPFVIVGGLLFIISSYFLYVPVDPSSWAATSSVSTTYFLGWFLMFYLTWTLVEIPHLAWGSELSSDSKESNRIFSVRAMAIYSGTLLFYLVPFLPIFSSNAFTPETLTWAVGVAGILLLPLLYICVQVTPDGVKYHIPKEKNNSLSTLRHETLANKPLLIFISAFALYGFGAVGMFFTLIFIFVDIYLGLGEYFALFSLIGIGSGLLTIGVWTSLANYLGKKTAWAMGVIFYIVAVVSAGFMEPGKTGIAAMAIVIILSYIGSIPVVALSPSLLADIIDFNTWKFGSDRAGTYFSFYTLVLKTSTAIGGSLGFGLVGWYGFETSAETQTDQAVFGLRLAACWIPALLMLVSVLLITSIPINARRHNIILRRLAGRSCPQTKLYQRPIVGKTNKIFSKVPS